MAAPGEPTRPHVTGLMYERDEDWGFIGGSQDDKQTRACR